jgi:hypothetical protein
MRCVQVEYESTLVVPLNVNDCRNLIAKKFDAIIGSVSLQPIVIQACGQTYFHLGTLPIRLLNP